MSTDTLRNFLDATIPSELRDLARWCNWRNVPRADGRPKKEPLDGASCTDPTTWLAYETARDRFVASQENGQDIAGLWFATGPIEPDDELAIAGFDFDHCVTDGVPTDAVYRVIDELKTYAEYSPGDGVRLVCWVPRGTRSIKRESEGFEFYADKRWLSITGRHSFRTPRELAVLDAETPRRLYEHWIGAANPDARDERPGSEKRKARATKEPQPKTASAGRRFEDHGVPVERMVAVTRRALKLLDDQRAENYGDWVNVLCSLKWIEEQTEAAAIAKLWHKFSKRCEDKYDREDAQKRWDGYEAPPGDERLTIGSLLRWASEDSGTPIAEIVADPKSEKSTTRKLGLTMSISDLSSITIEPVRWLWKGRIPESKLTIVGGDMGDGKSFVTLDIAARVSAGRDWPDGSRCPQGRVLIVNTEDDLSDTVKPRLLEAGADEAWIKVYRCMTDIETGDVERLNLHRDLPAIEEQLIEFSDLRLVLIDPVLSFAGDRNVNEYHSMYAILGPLNELAARHNVSILGNCHTNKADTMSAKHRITGSTAILAAARCAWIVLRDPDHEDRRRRLFLPLKQNNSAGEDTGLAFRITSDDPEGVAHVEWSDEVIEETADEVLRRTAKVRIEKGRDPESLDAVRFLQEILKDGPVDATRIETEAKEFGVSLKACKRHKKKLDIVVRRVGGFGAGGNWEWCLPDHLDQRSEAEPF